MYVEELRGKTRKVEIVCLQAEIQTHDLPDAKQECYPPYSSVRF
jgi:hypothetical protein